MRRTGEGCGRRRRWCRSSYLLQDFLFRTKGLNAPVAHRHDLVDGDERIGAMCYDDDNTAAAAHAGNGRCQCGLTLCVEVGVRFVQNGKERIAIKRAGKTDALTLPAERNAP